MPPGARAAPCVRGSARTPSSPSSRRERSADVAIATPATARVLMKGNEAIAEAAIQAGCDAYFGYPITPQAEILEWMARRMPELGRVFVQGESERGAIHMAPRALPHPRRPPRRRAARRGDGAGRAGLPAAAPAGIRLGGWRRRRPAAA